jgi:predicted ATPase/DNA-binding XRE family transcriptional regulator
MRADRESFGEVLRRVRSGAALSQEALAERAGLSKRGISDLERGARLAPRLETVRLLADALSLGEADRIALLAAARPGATATVPAVHARSSPPVALPRPPTRLIGREDDVATLCDLLSQQDGHLVTLTGPGGTGKTHLALAVAPNLHSHFPDGVVFVDLSPLIDPVRVLPTIASELGVRERGEEPVGQSLGRHLRDRRLLLVLDNCEQVLGMAPDLAALLAACPALTVLATSREVLRLRGEQEMPVAPLALPDPNVRSLAALSQVPAVALFVERARSSDPTFTLTAQNVEAVVSICRRLDGLPLAIELAAVRSKVLPPPALNHRLTHSLSLLTGGARDAPARQRTLRHAIAWSYDLLEPQEQVLFRHLAVFVGGGTLEAAEAVASSDVGDLLTGIASLVDASLLRQEKGEEGEPRFRMLETIREFGLERLEASGEESATRDRHTRYFRDLAERTNVAIVKTPTPELLDMIEREHDNLRTALMWSRDTGDHDTFLRLAGALAMFWYYRGYLNEGQRWLSQALETPPDDASPRPSAWALTMSGMLASVAGATERATSLLMESFPWWERSGDAWGSAFAGSQLGGSYVGQGRYDEATPLFATTEAHARDAGHDDLLAIALFHLGAIAWAQGDDARARDLLRDAVERFDRFGTPADAIDPLRYLGLLTCAAGDDQEAATWLAEVLTRLRQRGSRAAIAVGLADVATFAAAREAWLPAARLFAQAESLLRAEAAAFSLPARDHYERAHARAREALGDAAQTVAAAGRALTLEQALAEAEEVLNLDDTGDAGVSVVL